MGACLICMKFFCPSVIFESFVIIWSVNVFSKPSLFHVPGKWSLRFTGISHPHLRSNAAELVHFNASGVWGEDTSRTAFGAAGIECEKSAFHRYQCHAGDFFVSFGDKATVMIKVAILSSRIWYVGRMSRICYKTSSQINLDRTDDVTYTLEILQTSVRRACIFLFSSVADFLRVISACLIKHVF